MTPVRKSILDVLKTSNTPVSVQDILSQVRANKTTIYRDIDFLIAQRQVTSVEFGDGKKRYELVEKGHHHHLVCNICGRIECFDLENNLDQTEKEIADMKSFKVTAHLLEFFGQCQDCQKNIN